MRTTEELMINPKRTYSLYREKGLQVRTKRRKELNRPRVPMLVPTRSINAGRWISFQTSSPMAAVSEC